MVKHSERTVGHLNRPVSRLEKRDWQLWVIVSFAGIVVSAGLLVILIGAAFRLEINVLRSLAIGLFVLLALLNAYLLTKRLQLRRVRAPLILTTLEWNSGGLHPQLRRQAPWQRRAPDPSGAVEPVEPRSDSWDQGRD
jgi:cytochrome c biogenesis protein CcdA